MKSLSQLNTKIFADGADKAGMLDMYRNPIIQGFTTNPTLMRKAGVQNYMAFAHDILTLIKDKPISFEVFSDDFKEMYAQALEIASWGQNVYVKIPVMNTKGFGSYDLIHQLAKAGVKQNVTALMTTDQMKKTVAALKDGPAACISIFAGRIADTGLDPIEIMKQALKYMQPYPHLELIWASPRELLNIFQANDIGCHIITATNDILKKLSLVGKNLEAFSLETVKMFYDDAKFAGFSLEKEVVA
ncbi:MAG TPA: transaldolase [Gammaproteobacteria bacterium]|jgi:transaldolase|nr:transaldolase [Gammaproteobacteria bacterium]